MKFEKCSYYFANPEESLALELTTHVAELFEARGFEVIAYMGRLGKDSEEYGVDRYRVYINDMMILIQNVYRSNGTEKNTSAEIILYKKDAIHENCHIYVCREKLIKGSGEKAINNRITKILEKVM